MPHSITKALLYLVVIYSFIVFSSLSLSWIPSPYDAWRVYEIILLLCINIFSIVFIIKSKYMLWIDKKNRNVITTLLISITSLVLLSCFFAQDFERALADASLYFLLFSACIIYSNFFYRYPKTRENIAAWLAILPILTLIFLPISLIDRLNGGIGFWTQSFTFFRMLDDALLPCLFLLWFRPAWLNINNIHQKYKFLCHISVYTISTIYICNFLFHGSRACAVGITLGLIFIALYYKKQALEYLKLPLISIFFAIFFYIVFYWLTSKTVVSTLVRGGSTYRLEQWIKAWENWLNKPLLGHGGNHFSLLEPFTLWAHPHNIVVKFLTEWGISLFLFLSLLLLLTLKTFKHIKQIPPILIAGCIAVSTNSVLSGSLVYPASQVLNILLIALTISFIPRQKNTHVTQSKSLGFAWVCIILIFSIGILSVHSQDMICQNCMSLDDYGAPAFWDYGRALHLEKVQ